MRRLVSEQGRNAKRTYGKRRRAQAVDVSGEYACVSGFRIYDQNIKKVEDRKQGQDIRSNMSSVTSVIVVVGTSSPSSTPSTFSETSMSTSIPSSVCVMGGCFALVLGKSSPEIRNVAKERVFAFADLLWKLASSLGRERSRARHIPQVSRSHFLDALTWSPNCRLRDRNVTLEDEARSLGAPKWTTMVTYDFLLDIYLFC